MTTAPSFPDASDFDLPDQTPWDRQAGEPLKNYSAFRLFRDLTPMQRSFDRIADQANLSARRLRAIAVEWDWHERVSAWDDACHRIEDRERLEAIRSMHAVHRRAGRAAIMKALQALTMLDAETMPASIIARLMELGAKLERSTLIVSIEELQGIELGTDDDTEDPWERIARELDPANAPIADL
jgi:hypothetical protein